MTAILLVTGTVAIVIFEWNHAFAGMTVTEKWVQGFFNATCPRTAGFSSVGMTTFSVQTLLLMVVLMIVVVASFVPVGKSTITIMPR